MSKYNTYSPRLIALMHSLLVFVHKTLLILIIVYCAFIWMLSPNKVVALALIFCTTTLPLFLVACISNGLAFVALKHEEVFQSDFLCVLVKRLFALSVVLYGKLLHGYEIFGEDELPETTGALLVYYHALLPLDCLYLVSESYLKGRRQLSGIMHRLVMKQIPCLSKLFDFHGDRDRLVKDLKQGQLCSVAPGGGLEGAFSENYEIFWNGRIGFAEVAKECAVPVIPMFTANSREAMPVTTYGFKDLFRAVYDGTKRVIFLPLLCFPVKLRIFVGKPLYCKVDESPAEFAERVKAAIHELRDKHQRSPGDLISALLERFGYRPFVSEAHCPGTDC